MVNDLFHKTPQEKMNDAILNLLDKNAPLGVILYSTKFNYTNSDRVKNMVTNGSSIWVNNKWLLDSNQSEVNLALLKILTKMYLGHHIRMPRNLDPKSRGLWNLGCSLAVNSILKTENKMPEDEPVPGRGKFAAVKDNSSAEDYFEFVKAMDDFNDGKDDHGEPSANQGGASGSGRESSSEGDGGDGISGSGAGGGDGNAGGPTGDEEKQSGNDQSSEPPDGDTDNNQSDTESENPEGDEGGSDDEEEDTGNDQPDGGNGSCDADVPEELQTSQGLGSVTEADNKDTAESDWRETVAGVNAAAMSAGYGKSQGWLVNKANESLSQVSHISWKTELKRKLTKLCNTAWNYNRLSRRHGWRRDIIMPNTRDKTLHKAVMVIDSSGSMDDRRCALGLKEVEAVMKCFPQSEIVIMQCDTRIIEASIRTIKKSDFPIDQKWYGRGGTNLSPAFDYIKKNLKDAAAVLVMSDMEWDVAHCTNPNIPTIWLDCSRDGYEVRKQWLGDRAEPRFGRMLRVELED